jgi:hypothetical protein
MGKAALAIALVFLMMAGLVACEVKLWRDCRQDHSVLYCMRTLG